MSLMLETFRDALIVESDDSNSGADGARIEAIIEVFRAVSSFLNDARTRQDSEPLLQELQSVIQMVAVEVLEIRGSRAMRSILRV